MWERKTHLSIELAHVMNGHVDGLRWVGEYVGLGQPLAVGHQGGAVVHRHLRLHLLLPPVEAPTVHWAASQRCVIVDAGHAQGFVLLLRGESYAGDARAQREFLNNIGHKLNNTGILSLELKNRIGFFVFRYRYLQSQRISPLEFVYRWTNPFRPLMYMLVFSDMNR